MMRFVRSAFVIARRDFSATVLSKAFIFFLLAPLFPLLMGGVFGGIGARVASRAEQPVIGVVGPAAEFQRLDAARKQLSQAIPEGNLLKLVHFEPERDAAAQEKKLLAGGHPPLRAVLTGGLEHPHIVGSLGSDPGTTGQLRLLISTALSGNLQTEPELAVTKVEASPGSNANDRMTTAYVAQMGLFLLTLMLSTMVLSQLIEEKSNKIIEVIAAAVRIDAMFVGKLFAMLSASVLALIVWITAGALFVQMVKHGGVQSLPVPAIGWPGFLALAIVYFAMNYLLFGAAFLTIGAQASTAREVQTMSLPVTFAQVLIFGFAAKAIGRPDSLDAIIAMVFPLSSPMAMLARAAEDGTWWPHFVAIAWQTLCISVILQFGAKLFRKTVLKSGPKLPWWRFGRA
ncbi:MAG TPA: ABC transporter permease [Sphingomicrobium sp.]